MNARTVKAFLEAYADCRDEAKEWRNKSYNDSRLIREAESRSADNVIRASSAAVRADNMEARAERAEHAAELLRAKYEPRTALPAPADPLPAARRDA